MLLREAAAEIARLRAELAQARAAAVDVAEAEIARPEAEMLRAYEGFSRLLVRCAPQCQPLPDLAGLCSQLDNLLVGQADAPRPVADPSRTPEPLCLLSDYKEMRDRAERAEALLAALQRKEG